jgi:hypothetical protein
MHKIWEQKAQAASSPIYLANIAYDHDKDLKTEFGDNNSEPNSLPQQHNQTLDDHLQDQLQSITETQRIWNNQNQAWWWFIRVSFRACTTGTYIHTSSKLWIHYTPHRNCKNRNPKPAENRILAPFDLNTATENLKASRHRKLGPNDHVVQTWKPTNPKT